VENFNWQEFALLDFSFSNFVTTKLIKFIYGIALVFAVLGFLGMVIAGIALMFSEGVAAGFAFLCLSPFVLFISILLARVYSEFIIVIFRIAENMSELVEQGRSKPDQENTPG
jgi:energy-coupling factor transporter transmembrane protein EcfT